MKKRGHIGEKNVAYILSIWNDKEYNPTGFESVTLNTKIDIFGTRKSTYFFRISALLAISDLFVEKWARWDLLVYG